MSETLKVKLRVTPCGEAKVLTTRNASEVLEWLLSLVNHGYKPYFHVAGGCLYYANQLVRPGTYIVTHDFLCAKFAFFHASEFEKRFEVVK